MHHRKLDHPFRTRLYLIFLYIASHDVIFDFLLTKQLRSAKRIPVHKFYAWVEQLLIEIICGPEAVGVVKHLSRYQFRCVEQLHPQVNQSKFLLISDNMHSITTRNFEA